jgi:hypothetical protein
MFNLLYTVGLVLIFTLVLDSTQAYCVWRLLSTGMPGQMSVSHNVLPCVLAQREYSCMIRSCVAF